RPGPLAVHLDADLRNGDLAFALDVGEARDPPGDGLDLLGEAVQHVGIRTVDLDRDRGGNAAQHGRGPMPDRLTDAREGPGQGREPLANLLEHDAARASSRVELDVVLVHGHRHDVVVALSPAGPTPDAANLRDFLEDAG